MLHFLSAYLSYIYIIGYEKKYFIAFFSGIFMIITDIPLSAITNVKNTSVYFRLQIIKNYYIAEKFIKIRRVIEYI